MNKTDVNSMYGVYMISGQGGEVGSKQVNEQHDL